jgi:phosphoribosyl-ATP pyrophosphohydrolase/phosphoribosyl-AMP cyclohydrolase
MTAFSELKWDETGLIPAVVQDELTQQVLMVAWMNEEALRQTLTTGYVHFWSRSRKELWRKGATSGHVMVMSEILYDCDGDALVVRVAVHGPACHTGETSCFYRSLSVDDLLAAGEGSRRAAGAQPAFVWPKEAGEGADS